jgi:hypothetical protein
MLTVLVRKLTADRSRLIAARARQPYPQVADFGGASAFKWGRRNMGPDFQAPCDFDDEFSVVAWYTLRL